MFVRKCLRLYSLFVTNELAVVRGNKKYIYLQKYIKYSKDYA